MTVRQVMNEIAAMTPEERGQVTDFLRRLEGATKAPDVSERSIEEISDRILDRHADLMRKLAS
ncbi:MAG: hypothetical protein WDO13_07480 [Verrucomicrobiota bacterium]